VKEAEYIKTTPIFKKIKVFHLKAGTGTIDKFNNYDGKA
jgi:hypothetical protein